MRRLTAALDRGGRGGGWSGGPAAETGFAAALWGSGADLVDVGSRGRPDDPGGVGWSVRWFGRARLGAPAGRRRSADLAVDERERVQVAVYGDGPDGPGWQAVGPLAACFLPAFVLVGVVPVVVGVAGTVLGDLP